MSTAARIDELRNRFQDNPRRYFASLANELRRAGSFDEAIALCREYLPQVPGHMSGYIVFGQALFDAGQLDEARTIFEQALVQDPENLIALRYLGDIDRRRGDAASARRWYERVLEADPRNDDIAAQLVTLSQSPSWGGADIAAIESAVVTPLHTPAEWSGPADPADPFRFGPVDDAPLVDATGAVVVDDAAFEEGLVAPEWPDTSVLADRAAAPRRAESVPVLATAAEPSVVEAFGTEPSIESPEEPVLAPMHTPVLAPTIEPTIEPASEPAINEVPSWLRTPVAQEAQASVSFADVHPDVPIVPVTATPVSSPAFVTATMGELFVSQGFLDRAVTVYEELVRQRPGDLDLTRRLTELRDQIEAPSARAAGPRTVRERFAALAARRVRNTVPASAGRTEAAVISVSDDLSLDALFGSGGTADDRRAAQVFAEAFKPVTEAPSDFLVAMDRLPSQAATDFGLPPRTETVRRPTPSMVDEASSFDRFFPDPAPGSSPPGLVPPGSNPTPAAAKAADDLAEFSAWLKGLGNP